MNQISNNSFFSLFKAEPDPETSRAPLTPRLEVGATYVWRPKKYPSPKRPGELNMAMLTAWVGGDVHSDGSVSPAELVSFQRNDVVTVIDIVEALVTTGSLVRGVNYIGLFQGQTITFSIDGTWQENIVKRRAVYDSFVHINKVRTK